MLELISPPANPTIDRDDPPPAEPRPEDASAPWASFRAAGPFAADPAGAPFGFRDLGSHPVGGGRLAVRVGRPLEEGRASRPWPAAERRQVVVVVAGSALAAAAEPTPLRPGDAVHLDPGRAGEVELADASADFTFVQVSEPVPGKEP